MFVPARVRRGGENADDHDHDVLGADVVTQRASGDARVEDFLKGRGELLVVIGPELGGHVQTEVSAVPDHEPASDDHFADVGSACREDE